MANKLRNKIVERLVKDFGERDTINPWGDVYDNCVYKIILLEFYTVEKWQEKRKKVRLYQDEGRAYIPVFTS